MRIVMHAYMNTFKSYNKQMPVLTSYHINLIAYASIIQKSLKEILMADMFIPY